MAKNFIPVQRDSNVAIFAGETLGAIASLRTAMEKLDALKGKMDCNWTAGDFADLETRFGIPTGSGNLVYAWVRDSLLGLRAADGTGPGQTLTSRVG